MKEALKLLGHPIWKFFLNQWPFAFETTLFVRQLVGASKIKDEKHMFWFYSIVLMQISCYAGGTVSRLLMAKPPVIFTNDLLVPLAVSCWVLINKCPGDLVYKGLKKPFMKQAAALLIEIYRSNSMLNTIELANRTFKASRYYPTPLFGPILVGTIASSSGNFIPLSKGLKTIEKQVPWNIQCGFISAIFYHLTIYDDFMIGTFLRHFLFGHHIDRLTARFVVITFFVVMGQVHCYFGPHINPFTPVHRVLYKITGTARTLHTKFSSKNLMDLSNSGRKLLRRGSTNITQLHRSISSRLAQSGSKILIGPFSSPPAKESPSAVSQLTKSSEIKTFEQNNGDHADIRSHGGNETKDSMLDVIDKVVDTPRRRLHSPRNESFGDEPGEMKIAKGLSEDLDFEELTSRSNSQSRQVSFFREEEGPTKRRIFLDELTGAFSVQVTDRDFETDLIHALMIIFVPLLLLGSYAYSLHPSNVLEFQDQILPGQYLAECTHFSSVRNCTPRILMLNESGILNLYEVSTPREAKGATPTWISHLNSGNSCDSENQSCSYSAKLDKSGALKIYEGAIPIWSSKNAANCLKEHEPSLALRNGVIVLGSGNNSCQSWNFKEWEDEKYNRGSIFSRFS